MASPSPETTRRAARSLARALAPDASEASEASEASQPAAGQGAPAGCPLLALVGPLGAGKTAFVKGLAEGLGLDPAAVGSPTFVIACEYPLPDGRRLGHVDLYRVTSEEELLAAGFLDLLAPEVVLAVEWADRLPDALPPDHLELRIQRDPAAGEEARRIAIRAGGARAEALARRWREAAAEDGVALSEGRDG